MSKITLVLISSLIILGVTALGIYVYMNEHRKPVFEVYFFHLNRGRSILMRTPHNKSILIDGGQTGDIMGELTKIFPFYKRRIDTVIITSPLAKSAGGLIGVVNRYEIGKVIRPDFAGTSTASTALDRIIKEKGISVESITREFEIDEVEFKALFPEQLVLQISHASTTLILLGDLSKKDQRSIVGQVSTSTLVEYSHGGADSRVFADLFYRLNPEKIVVTKKSQPSTSKTKKKFDINRIDPEKIFDVEKGTVHFEFT